MSEEKEKRPAAAWQGWVNILIGLGLGFRYGSPMVGLLRAVHAGQISGRGLLIAGSFTTLNIVLALMTVATGVGQIGTRTWAPMMNAITGGAVLMNAGYRLVVFGPGRELDAQTLMLYGPDVVLIFWWLFGVRRGPWVPALMAAAANWLANQGINAWLSQTRY